MATLNVGMKVSRAISGATTVNANAIAVVTYATTSTASIPGTPPSAAFGVGHDNMVQRMFGPGQAVPASITLRSWISNGAFWTFVDITYTLQSGFELINTI